MSRKRKALIGGVIIFAAMVAVSPKSGSSAPADTPSPSPTQVAAVSTPTPSATATASVDVTPEPAVAEQENIPGLAAVDLTANLEDRGFDCTSQLDLGNVVYQCDLFHNGLEEATAYGDSPTELHSVYGLASGDPKVVETFLAYIATLPYDGSKPHVARDWVHTNFGKEDAETSIGGVTFQLSNNSLSISVR